VPCPFGEQYDVVDRTAESLAHTLHVIETARDPLETSMGPDAAVQGGFVGTQSHAEEVSQSVHPGAHVFTEVVCLFNEASESTHDIERNSGLSSRLVQKEFEPSRRRAWAEGFGQFELGGHGGGRELDICEVDEDPSIMQ